ncbi:MAG TPA: cytochrome P450 [Acidimicrobiales bacterium]|nr:cytochrome P450 [Acidimicrobiales bacterium]
MDTVDLLSPDFYADIDGMHEALGELRRASPLWRDEANDLLAVLGQPEIIEVERRSNVFSSDGAYRSVVQPPGMERDMIALDDPDHAAQRSLVARKFTPRAVRRLEPAIESIVDDLVGRFVDRGEMEVVDELAAPLPALLTARLIGFGPDHAESVRSWSERLMRIDQVMKDVAVGAQFMTAIMEFSQTLAPIAEQRRACPVDDLVSVWTHSDLGGEPVPTEVIVQETGLFISGGAETSRTVISRGLVELARHPDMWEAMAAEPGLIPGAVEELLRWVTPLNNFFRTAKSATTIGDTEVEEGQRLILLYPSANRDERIFDQPYRFDIRRTPNQHVAFGFGTHFCLGSSLARLQLRLLLQALTHRITDLTVLDGPDIEPNIFVGAVRSCHLGFRRRS